MGVDPRSVAEGTPLRLSAVRAIRIMALALALTLVPAVARAAASSITYTLSGTPGSNDWYVSPVTVHWTVSGSSKSSSGCEPAVLIPDDTTGTTRTCSVTWTDGSTASAMTSVIRIDQTPPVASAVATSRAPDHDGWFTSPVVVGWSGTDATSGIDSCTALAYGGPDAAPAPLSGTCRDRAGNTSAPLATALLFDATPPAPPRVGATAGDASIALAWEPSADTSSVTVTRSPGVAGARATIVYEGTATTVRDHGLRNGVRYTYTVTASDAAGNVAVKSVAATPASFLARPPLAAMSSTSEPPVLRWKAVRRARYYNVQIYHGGHQVLNAWPTRAALRLRSSWRYRNRSRHLDPGLYRWYVWPGYGARRGRHYGKLLGRSEFTVAGA